MTAIAPMVPRDPTQAHRAATPLELLFDLTFVVAIAQAASSLHHGLVEGHVAESLVAYPLVFFAIWWAWMNFTWFASAFDNDDALYRVTVLAQMAGVLVVAAGVPQAFETGDFLVPTIGYVVMRVALVGQWLRASRHPESRRCAQRFALGVGVLQLGWLALLAVPQPWNRVGFLVLAALELLVPVWAERAGHTQWHPGHIAERYGLFTIIVLGESVFAATLAVQSALDAGEALKDLLTIAIGGLVIVFALWWLYFSKPAAEMARDARAADGGRVAATFGYGHFVLFLAGAAVGAGVSVAVDQAGGHSALSPAGAGLAVTVPVAVYLLTLGGLFARRARESTRRIAGLAAAIVLVLASSWTPEPVLATGLILALLVAWGVVLPDWSTRRAVSAERSRAGRRPT